MITNIFNTIDGLFAYDQGSLDSGIKDNDLKNELIVIIKSLSEDNQRKLFAEYARTFLTNEATEAGYGIEDVIEFHEWIKDLIK
jgi:hypothetical protein